RLCTRLPPPPRSRPAPAKATARAEGLSPDRTTPPAPPMTTLLSPGYTRSRLRLPCVIWLVKTAWLALTRVGRAGTRSPSVIGRARSDLGSPAHHSPSPLRLRGGSGRGSRTPSPLDTSSPITTGPSIRRAQRPIGS